MIKIINNVGWIFFDKIFRLLIGMVVSVWIARYLGPDDFGLLNYALLFPTVFAVFANLGLNNVLLVDLVSAKDDINKQNQLVQIGLTAKLLAGAFVYILSTILNYFLNRDNLALFHLINLTATLLILQGSDVIDTYFQAKTKAKISVKVKIVAFITASLLRIYALSNSMGVVYLVIINIFESFLIYGLEIYVYQKKANNIFNRICENINYRVISQLLSLSWPIMITEFFVFVYMKIDQFMIESLSTSRELGLYGAALRLSETWYFVAGAITASFYPKIAESWPFDKNKFYRQYENLLNILIYISISLSLFITFFADKLISLLFGGNFQGAGAILSVHIWAGVFVFVGVGSNNLMIIKNLQRFTLLKTVFGASLNVLLNLYLIPNFGAMGASVATLVSYGFQAYVLNIFSKEARTVFQIQSKSFINFITLKRPMLTDFY